MFGRVLNTPLSVQLLFKESYYEVLFCRGWTFCLLLVTYWSLLVTFCSLFVTVTHCHFLFASFLLTFPCSYGAYALMNLNLVLLLCIITSSKNMHSLHCTLLIKICCLKRLKAEKYYLRLVSCSIFRLLNVTLSLFLRTFFIYCFLYS